MNIQRHRKPYFDVSVYVKFSLLMLMLMLSFLLFSCKTSARRKNSTNQKLEYILKNSTILNHHQVGFSLYDPNIKENIISMNGDKYFTPASNTKLLTFLTSIAILEDSIDVIKYQLMGSDSLVFKGTAYPLSFNPEVLFDTSLIHFLKSREEQLYYCEDHFQMARYGSGWAWDDAAYAYQRDISPLPLYANAIKLNNDSNNLTQIFPEILNDRLDISYGDDYSSVLNNGKYQLILDNVNREVYLPFRTSESQTRMLLSRLCGKSILECPSDLTRYNQALKVKLDDSIYVRLLHQSDNFIAEQLLLMCSSKIYDTLSTAKIIKYAQQHILQTTDMRWVDGSGLSRYNLISPHTFINILIKIYDKLGMERIKYLFPAIGDRLTEGGYATDNYKETPIIYAKTGTLSNNHNLSGYIITKQKRLLIFSFMNNHYLGSSTKVKKEMMKVLYTIWSEM